MAHVLVVDDEPTVLVLARRVLGRAGHRVSCAETLDGAVAIAEVDPVDVVLSDKNLPGATGFQVIDALRRFDPELPAILMTAYPEPLLATGTRIQGYLPKPMESIDSIIEAVERVLAFAREERKTPVPRPRPEGADGGS